MVKVVTWQLNDINWFAPKYGRDCFHFCSGNWKAAINGNKVRIDRLDWGFYMYFNREIYKAAVINLEGSSLLVFRFPSSHQGSQQD